MVTRRHTSLRARQGLSLLELLLAVTMVSILIITAFLSFQGYIEEARKVSTLNRMDALRKALETWSSDHQRDYPTYDLRPLLGRYIPSDEADGWGNDFVVDRYFMRILSRGPNGILETSVPGLEESPLLGSGGDDLVQEAQENGRLVLQGAGLYSVRPDGRRLVELAAGITGGDLSPGGGAFVYANNSGAPADVMWRDWLSQDDTVGDYDLSNDSVSPTISLTWFGNAFFPGNWGSVSIAPDGIHVAALQDNGGTPRIIVGELVHPAEGQGAPPYQVLEDVGGLFANGINTRMTWDRRGGLLYLEAFNAGDRYLVKVNSAPGSRITTPTWGKTPGVVIQGLDQCVTRDRFVFIKDAKTIIASATGSTVTSMAVTGGDTAAAISRRGDAVAVFGGGEVWIWWPDRPVAPANPGNPYRVLDSATVTSLGLGAIVQLRWR